MKAFDIEKAQENENFFLLRCYMLFFLYIYTLCTENRKTKQKYQKPHKVRILLVCFFIYFDNKIILKAI